MTWIVLVIWLFLVIWVLLLKAFPSPIIATPYEHINILYQTGLHQEAATEALAYLHDYPADGDVRLVLAKSYVEQQHYTKAREALLTILQNNPDYIDASLILIDMDLMIEHYQDALNAVTIALLSNPINPVLLSKKNEILAFMQAEAIPSILVSGRPLLLVYPETPPTIDESKRLKALYQSGKHLAAIRKANTYLRVHPSDNDVRLFLGASYLDEKAYEPARLALSTVLKQTPHNVDARLILINVEMSTHHYDTALDLIHAGLKLDPNDKRLIAKQHQIQSAIQSETKAALLRRQQSTARLNSINEKNVVDTPKYLNEVGIYQQQYYVSDVHQAWDYSTLYYGRQTDFGKLYTKMTYATRLSHEAVQGEIEAYPRIGKNLYLDLDFTFANQPNLFPDKAYGAEAYFSNLTYFNYSLGFKYNDIDENHHFTMYTGSLSKDYNKNRILFRPYYFVPGNDKPSALYILDIRHTITDPYFYYGCIFGAGTSPDLANLTTIDFIVLENKLINPYINIPFLNDRLITNFGVLLQNQIFPNGRIRNWYGGTIGLNWKFK